MATIIIYNNTSSQLSYLNGNVIVSANNNLNVSSQYVFPVSKDPGLNYDLTLGNAYLGDGFTNYSGSSAINYLAQVSSSIGGSVVGELNLSTPSYAILVGAQDSNGNTQPAHLNGNNHLLTADVINTSITSGSITVGTSAVPLNVSGSNLSHRKVLIVTPINGIIFWGASNSVTTSTGQPIYPNWTANWEFGDKITIYAISSSPTTVNIFEGS